MLPQVGGRVAKKKQEPSFLQLASLLGLGQFQQACLNRMPKTLDRKGAATRGMDLQITRTNEKPFAQGAGAYDPQKDSTPDPPVGLRGRCAAAAPPPQAQQPRKDTSETSRQAMNKQNTV